MTSGHCGIGSQISYLALPLTAAVWLEATPADMGLLAAMESLPSLVVGLFAGVLSMPMLYAITFLSGACALFFDIAYQAFLPSAVAQISVRQAIVPEPLLGRVGGTLNVLGWGTVPVGALIGGLLGQGIGLQPTLVVAALLEASIALWIWWSPLWKIPPLHMLAG